MLLAGALREFAFSRKMAFIMKTLIFIIKFHWLRFFFGIAMLVCAFDFWRSYVHTPANMPFESLADMLYPWFPIVTGAVGLWCVASAWRRGWYLASADDD